MASISRPVISTPTLLLVALTSAVYNQLIAVQSHRERTGTGTSMFPNPEGGSHPVVTLEFARRHSKHTSFIYQLSQ